MGNCFRSLILPENQVGEVPKKNKTKVDNMGSNLSFSVVVVVIVWGIIFGVMCVKGNRCSQCFNFSDSRIVSRDDTTMGRNGWYATLANLTSQSVFSNVDPTTVALNTRAAVTHGHLS